MSLTMVCVVQCQRCHSVELGTVESVATMASFHLTRSLTNVAACYVDRIWNNSTSTFRNVVIVCLKSIMSLFLL